jgi:hypothetical protein
MLKNLINYNDFMSGKKILHTNDANNYNDALHFKISNEDIADAITYNEKQSFAINNIDVLGKTYDGKYYYNYILPTYADVIDNILVECDENVEIKYLLGGVEYKVGELNEYLVRSCVYHTFIIRIIFLQKPKNETEFNILFRNYIFNLEHRKILGSRPFITSSTIYYNGISKKIDNK